MKNIINKINIKNIVNLFIILVVIALYIFSGIFMYNHFRERKRNEITNDLIKKIDKEIKTNIENNNASKNTNNFKQAVINYENFNYTILGKIKIDKINIYEPILRENTKLAMDTALVKIAGPNLNDFGNVSIGGHNFMKGNYFIKINKLIKDDEIIITDLLGNSVSYFVYEYGITSIDDVSYLKQPNNKKDKVITLVTCTKGGKERYFVKAKAK